MESIEKAYLTPPDNEAIPVLKCFFCEEDICEGEDYYVLNGFYCCKDCLDIHFKFTAELPIMIRSAALPVAEAAVLANRKKYRAVRSAPSEQCDNISDRAAERADFEYHDLKNRGET